jgi:hypothetical protein
MPPSNKSKWKCTAETYLDLWILPNCIGSIDGKHICIKCFPKTRSLYFNYTGYFSVVLLACADANALFTVHVGYFSMKEELNFPFPTSLPLDESSKIFPYYFIAENLPYKNAN